MKKSLSSVLTQLKSLQPQNFLLLLIAGIVNSIGVTMFLAPVQIYDSGISGTSMLLAQITPEGYTLSLFLVLLNIPLFLFGLKKQGVTFTIYSIWAVIVYSTSSFVITNILPVDVSTASPFAGTDLLLCAIFGGLISGAGSGMTIRFGGAMDGMEVMAVIFSRGLGITVGSFVMVYNTILYILIGCICHSWILPLYSILAYCAGIKSVDFIVEGLDKAKSAMIVTTRANEISSALSEAFGRGVTHIDARGFYSGKEQTIIYFVINRFQIARMKNIVIQADPNAFISISEVSDVLGKSVKK